MGKGESWMVVAVVADLGEVGAEKMWNANREWVMQDEDEVTCS